MSKTLKRPAALKHLQEEGWEVAKTKFYADIKKGFPSLQDDKTLLLADLNAYARAYLKRQAGADAGHAMAEDQSEKTREEILKIRVQRENTQFDLSVKQKKYLPRADFSREMASRAVVLDTSLPVWERGLKEAHQETYHQGVKSLPVWERGLKDHSIRLTLRPLWIAPRVGAWIERVVQETKGGLSRNRSPCGSVD